MSDKARGQHQASTPPQPQPGSGEPAPDQQPPDQGDYPEQYPDDKDMPLPND